MKILGIDPGTASTGYGVIEGSKKSSVKSGANKASNYHFECVEYGLIQTHPSSVASKRLQKLNNDLSRIIKRHKPEVLAVESLFFCKNLKTAIPVSQARGVILLTAAKQKVPVYGLTPMEIKMTVTGYGWSKKPEVQKEIMNILKLKNLPKPDDAADALAVAITYYMKDNHWDKNAKRPMET